MKKTAILGANPAWQKTLSFSGFTTGKVNRADTLTEFASGKGINCARACRCYGKSEPHILQFAGGDNGKRLVSFLDGEKFFHATVKTSAPTRCCTTLLDSTAGITTECIEPSYAAEPDEVTELLQKADDLLAECDAAAVCGTLPGNTPLDVYTSFALTAKKHGVPLLLDACKGINDAIDCGCTIDLKINAEELFLLSGYSEIREAIKKLFDLHANLRYIAVTDGPGTAFASDGINLFSYTVPRLPEIVSTLGCGDTASAVFCTELAAGTPFEISFQYALGAASANCLSSLCGCFDPVKAQEIAGNIKIERVPRS